ncbi:MAG: hypothetical protein WED00_07740 [Aquisalimonadaceae bacterium]
MVALAGYAVVSSLSSNPLTTPVVDVNTGVFVSLPGAFRHFSEPVFQNRAAVTCRPLPMNDEFRSEDLQRQMD